MKKVHELWLTLFYDFVSECLDEEKTISEFLEDLEIQSMPRLTPLEEMKFSIMSKEYNIEKADFNEFFYYITEKCEDLKFTPLERFTVSLDEEDKHFRMTLEQE